MANVFKDISQFTLKSAATGTEEFQVSATEKVTAQQIAALAPSQAITNWAKMLESAYSPIRNTDTLLAALQKLQVLIENGDGYVFRCYDSNSNIIGVAFGSSDGARGLRAICYHNTSNKLMICSGTVTLPAFIRMSEADQSTWLREHIEHSIPVEDIQIGGVNIFSFSELEQGGINNGTGAPAAINTRLRSKDFYPISGKYISVNSFNDIYKFLWLFYDEEYSYINKPVSWDFITSFPTVAEIPEGAAYVKYMIVRNDNAVLTPDDAKEDCLIKVELGNKPSLSWSPSVADLQVTDPVTISDFKNLPSVVTSAADGVVMPIIAPASASNGPAGLSSAGPGYGYVQVAKVGSSKAYNYMIQLDGSGSPQLYSGFCHIAANTISWTQIGGSSAVEKLSTWLEQGTEVAPHINISLGEVQVPLNRALKESDILRIDFMRRSEASTFYMQGVAIVHVGAVDNSIQGYAAALDEQYVDYGTGEFAALAFNASTKLIGNNYFNLHIDTNGSVPQDDYYIMGVYNISGK